jgi:hypothetical protein
MDLWQRMNQSGNGHTVDGDQFVSRKSYDEVPRRIQFEFLAYQKIGIRKI